MKKLIIFISLFTVIFNTKLYATEKSLLVIQDDDFFIGDSEAPITIIEYASMSCSHCADFHNNTLEDLKTEFIDTGMVKFVFRDFLRFFFSFES